MSNTDSIVVISFAEFIANQEKYFDMAIKEYIIIKRDDSYFMLTNASEDKKDENEPVEKKPVEVYHASYEMERIREERERHLFGW